MAEKVRTGQSDDHIWRQDEDPERTLDAGRPLHEIGSHIGGYKLLSTLGEGGLGMVYLAVNSRHGNSPHISPTGW